MLRVIIIWILLLLATVVSAREAGSDAAGDSVCSENRVIIKEDGYQEYKRPFYRLRDPRLENYKRTFTLAFNVSCYIGNNDSLTEVIGAKAFYALNQWVGVGGSAGAIYYLYDRDNGRRMKALMPFIAPTIALWSDYGLECNTFSIAPTAEIGMILHPPFRACAPEIGNRGIGHPYRTSPVSFRIKAGIIFMRLMEVGYTFSNLDTYRQFDPVNRRFNRKWQHGFYLGFRLDCPWQN